MTHASTLDSVRARLLAGESPAAIAADLGLDVTTDDLSVILPGWRADDGEAEVEYPAAPSGREAAEEYVGDGSWGEPESTIWIRVRAWQTCLTLTDDGEVIEERANGEEHTIAVDPMEPECACEEHDWCSPHSVLGGLRENPGVRGNGGGVIAREVCAHCGAYRVTDTWAQDPETGEQGLRSVSYEKPDGNSLAWVASLEVEGADRD